MILIISSKDDHSTVDVIDWLRRYNVPFERISSEDPISFLSLTISGQTDDAQIMINQNLYLLSDFTSVWYRRSWLAFEKTEFISELDEQFDNQVNDQLRSEVFYLNDFFDKYFLNRMLNRRGDVTLNKLMVLKQATQFGLKVPETHIISAKEILINLLKINKKKFITKNFSPGIFVGLNQYFLNSYTLEVSDEMIQELPQYFHPTLFQERIEKLFEIRSFYLNGSFYSSAILSQNDKKTMVDFRNYNHEKPNRTPPYKLPVQITDKLNDLMKELELQSGSIDLLVTVDGGFVFLEVNPIGQFSQVSKPCNYHLERKVADSLIHTHHERRNIKSIKDR